MGKDKMYNKIELINAQFTGFNHGKWYSLMTLIHAMDLARNDWEAWKKQCSNNVFTDTEIKEVDDYFNMESLGYEKKKKDK